MPVVKVLALCNSHVHVAGASKVFAKAFKVTERLKHLRSTTIPLHLVTTAVQRELRDLQGDAAPPAAHCSPYL